MLIAHGYPGVIELARANQTSHDQVVWTIVRTGESRIWLSEFRWGQTSMAASTLASLNASNSAPADAENTE